MLDLAAGRGNLSSPDRRLQSTNRLMLRSITTENAKKGLTRARGEGDWPEGEKSVVRNTDKESQAPPAIRSKLLTATARAWSKVESTAISRHHSRHRPTNQFEAFA